MLELMKRQDYSLVDDPQQADLIVLNTCHIREKATHKVLSRLGVLRDLKKDKPDLTIAVTGCVAQAEGTRLFDKAPVIDVLVGPGKIKELPTLVKEHKTRQLGSPSEQKGAHLAALGFDLPHSHPHSKMRESEAGSVLDSEGSIGKEMDPSAYSDSPMPGHNTVSRFVRIQQGCDNFCTFCVVPFTRGREISERPENIEARVRSLVNEHGAREITLLGQNVNSYGLDLLRANQTLPSEDGPFVHLLRRVSAIEGLERLHFTSSNPHDFSHSLARLFFEQPKMGRYLHLPVQSGSDEILSRMRRKVSRAQYDEKISWLREFVPDIALSTDLIVGFPGESDEDFEATYDLVQKTRFSFIFAFKYSPRKNTAAVRFRNQVPEDVKVLRLARLNALQDKITLEQQEAEIGREKSVLFQYGSRKEEGVYYGRCEHFRLVRVRSQRPISGMVLPVKIFEANKTALVGELL